MSIEKEFTCRKGHSFVSQLNICPLCDMERENATDQPDGMPEDKIIGSIAGNIATMYGVPRDLIDP